MPEDPLRRHVHRSRQPRVVWPYFRLQRHSPERRPQQATSLLHDLCRTGNFAAAQYHMPTSKTTATHPTHGLASTARLNSQPRASTADRTSWIAHVDHGTTTLMDRLLRQCGADVLHERAMDSISLEHDCTSVVSPLLLRLLLSHGRTMSLTWWILLAMPISVVRLSEWWEWSKVQ